jgi:Fe-S-cluster-containing hydrogenase component 2
MSRSDGVLTLEELRGCPGWPPQECIERKKVAVLECVEDIPCNPCEIICPVDAITVGSPITNLPVIDGDKCTGCNLCIAICPGLAIFVVEKNYDSELSVISIPYELLPLPKKGERVEAYDRSGKTVCKATITKVSKLKQFDRTAIVTFTVNKKYFNQVRHIKVST